MYYLKHLKKANKRNKKAMTFTGNRSKSSIGTSLS